MMASEIEMPGCVSGYHVYKEVWEAAIGEALECHKEPRVFPRDRSKYSFEKCSLYHYFRLKADENIFTTKKNQITVYRFSTG